ncbi:MAG: hypothetical protein MJY91_06395 [Bacteroidales bacterium]|nr:hypothetical protein [Bacteroidales bacterium]
MKKIFTVCIMLVAACASAFAQMDEREPGLYAINGEEEILLTPVGAVQSSSNTNILGIEVGKSKFMYKGITSDTIASGKFILVIDPEKKAIKQTLKMYDVFVATMTPANMIIVPLEVDKNRRVYDRGSTLNGFNTQKLDRVEFLWEQISDNSFLIEAEMAPGEYAIVFKPAKIGEFNFNTIFDFSVAFTE